MAEQNKDEMSMNEILKSIKNFVSSGNATDDSPSLPSAPAPTALSKGPQRTETHARPVDEPPFLSTEEKMQRVSHIELPEFMRSRSAPSASAKESAKEKVREFAPKSAALPPKNTEPIQLPGASLAPHTALNTAINTAPNAAPNTAPHAAGKKREGVREAFQLFAAAVEGATQLKNTPNGAFLQDNLDQMMKNTVKQAVSVWMDQNMQPIVEEMIQREIMKITQDIVKYSTEET